jgi:hypothetical protein
MECVSRACPVDHHIRQRGVAAMGDRVVKEADDVRAGRAEILEVFSGRNGASLFMGFGVRGGGKNADDGLGMDDKGTRGLLLCGWGVLVLLISRRAALRRVSRLLNAGCQSESKGDDGGTSEQGDGHRLSPVKNKKTTIRLRCATARQEASADRTKKADLLPTVGVMKGTCNELLIAIKGPPSVTVPASAL